LTALKRRSARGVYAAVMNDRGARSSTPSWGLSVEPPEHGHAVRVQWLWRWPTLLALMATIPAFYLELLSAVPSHLADGAPPSSTTSWALGLRLVVAFAILLRMVWTLRHLMTRGGLAYLLLIAVGVLGLCGVGFWWLEPRAHTLGDGLWLAFTTAATVGYGDIVPTTAASKIFSVFVVLLGFGVLSLVTAAIAATWVETEERRIEREILRDVHRQLRSVHTELAALRGEVRRLDKR
jgi:voltage-gated potassium channel